jgi:ribosomal protein S14
VAGDGQPALPGGNSSKVRIHHRCGLSGRPKGFYRKVKLSRIALREYANFGQVPGMTKASCCGGTEANAMRAEGTGQRAFSYKNIL